MSDPIEVPPIKSGWKSSETWITVLVQIIGAAGALGMISQPQIKLFGDWISNFVAAAFVLAGLIAQAVHYVHSRTALKAQAMDPEKGRSLIWLLAGCLLFLATPVQAQTHHADVHRFNWFGGGWSITNPPAPVPAPLPTTDPAVLAMLQNLSQQSAQQHAQIMTLLLQQRLQQQGVPLPQTINITAPPVAQVPPVYSPAPPGPPVYTPPAPGPPVYAPAPPGPPVYTPQPPGPPVYVPPSPYIQITPPGQPGISVAPAPVYTPPAQPMVPIYAPVAPYAPAAPTAPQVLPRAPTNSTPPAPFPQRYVQR